MNLRLLVVLSLFVVLLAVSAQAQPIDLGTAANFALLGGSEVTNTGSSVIYGSVGSSPTPSVTGFPPGVVNDGTLYLAANSATAQAQSDLTTAYGQAAGEPVTATLTGIDLDTYNSLNPLAPGVYFFSSSAELSGNLTLNGEGNPNSQWIFQIGSTLGTASSSTVSFINDASKCNVFWDVGSTATIGSGSDFAGTIMAVTSISLNGGTLEGRALAENGAVTITSAETVDSRCGTTAVPEASSMALLMMSLPAVALFRRRK